MDRTFSQTNMTQGKLPRLPFASLKKRVLGPRYALSLVFVTDAESRTLNRAYRGKNKPANILSFPLSPREGEIVIAPEEAKRDAVRFKKGYTAFIAILFIHGCLHLKGMRHGRAMEKEEEKFLHTLVRTRGKKTL